LAVGRSGIRRLRQGPMRDVLLEARYVAAGGRVIKGGGPTVKNVSGFDLCRLLVGSLGTLGFLGEVVLRCRPRPEVSRWFAGDAEPFDLVHRLHQPSSILWDGTTTWVLLEGHPADVEGQAAIAGLPEVGGPPPLPTGGRLSLRPSALRTLTGTVVAGVGVGVTSGAHRRHARRAVGRSTARPGLHPVHGPLRAVPGVRGRLPVVGAVRSPDGGGARVAGRRHPLPTAAPAGDLPGARPSPP